MHLRMLVRDLRKKRCWRKCGMLLLDAINDHPKPLQRTILLAGHETSATSMCWVLLELARHQDVQQKLREEIRATERAIHARGGSDFTATDLDNMPYLAAVLKVSFHHCIRDIIRFDQSIFLGIYEIPSGPLSKLPTSCTRRGFASI